MKKFIVLTGLLLALLYVPAALAVVTCQASDGSGTLSSPETSNVAVAGSFYAGNDMPVGSVLYRTTVRTAGAPGIVCDDAFTVPRYYSVSIEPAGPSFSQPGSPFSGDIYPTNVPGIGIALWYSGTTFTRTAPLTRTPYTRESAGGYGITGVFDISLIKTGPVDSGATVNASSFPTAIMYAGDAVGYAGLPITTWTVNFSGSISFITQTCQTPDVNVSMGSYEVREYFRGVGSTTPWVDASIQLQNCPTFTGYHGLQNPQSVTGSGTPSGGSVTANLLQVSLQPLSSMLDAGNGVFGVNASSGETPATGVGLQLGYTPDISASPLTPTTVWKSGDTWSVIPPNTGVSGFRIPLAARYYQTESVVTPGPADGKVIFTINYN